MDDDIVFLGSSPASATLPTTRPAQRPATGVSLHVEKNGTIDAHCLSFLRTTSTVVHIGRRSALDPEPDDTTTASFRCAVVSRRHAKIAFSDSGHAYLIDLGSHHGTHVRSPGDRLARALKPETPTLLVDGDIITFGKAVGKADECVRPIVVRVELLHDAHTPLPLQPLSLPTSSPASSKASSGRYGVRTSSSSSSDESAENDGYSDIEEIPPPVQLAPSANPPPSQPPSQASSSQTSFGPYPLQFKFKHITALKRFLPPMHVAPQDAPWHSNGDRTPGHGYRHPQPDTLATNYHAHFHPPALPLRLPPPAHHLHSMPTFVERPLAHLSQLSQFFLNGRGTGQASNASDANNSQASNVDANANVENAADESSGMNLAAEAGNTNPLPAVISPPPLLPPPEISEAYKRFMSQREPSLPDPNDIYYDAVPKLSEDQNNQERPYSPTREWSTLPPWNPMFPIHREKSLDGTGQQHAGAAPEDGELTPAAVHVSSSNSNSDLDSDSDSDSDSDFSAASSRNSERDQREKEREGERTRERGRDRATSEPMELASRGSSLTPAPRAVDKGKGRAAAAEVGGEVDADEGGEADMDIENELDAPVELDALRKRAEKTSQGVIRRIEEAVARLEADLTIHRGQTKATLTRHTNQMEVFDGRIREVDAECGVLCLRVETLGERLGVVEMDVASNTEANFNAIEAEAEKERVSEDARREDAYVVQALIAEAQEELRALKALRAEAEAFTAAARQQLQAQERDQVRRAVHASAPGSDADDGAPQPPVLPSLKRKRDDSDEDADADEAAHGSEHAPGFVFTTMAETATEDEKDKDVVMDASPLPLATSPSGFDSSASTADAASSSSSVSTLTPAAASTSRQPLPTVVRFDTARAPPRKRARRIAGLMARTATAVGVGAVVTWTALAFS